MPFPAEAARDLLGIIRNMYAAEDQPNRRQQYAQAGHMIRLALELHETDEAAAHAMVDRAIAIRQHMSYSLSFGGIFNAAVDRAKKKTG